MSSGISRGAAALGASDGPPDDRVRLGTRIASYTVMREPVQVTFHNMAADPALAEAVRTRAHWLETFDPEVGCRVALEFRRRHRMNGRAFNIHIQVSVPGKAVSVRYEASLPLPPDGQDEAHRTSVDEEAVAAINEAFDVARQLAGGGGPQAPR